MNLHQQYLELHTALKSENIENPRMEAIFILSTVLKVSKEDILLDKFVDLSRMQTEELSTIVKKRLQGYPLQYALGEWEFYGLPFYVGEGVLIPRQDTETLCETAIKQINQLDHSIVVDLCSGSGCIAVTISKYCPDAKVYAVEKSKAAYQYLCRNVKRNKVSVHPVCGDALDPFLLNQFPAFDFAISNPPYLSKKDIRQLQREVGFEPSQALLGGIDGLDFYREITSLWKKKIKLGGKILYEVGLNQEKDVRHILIQNEFKKICFEKDLCDIIRVVYAENYSRKKLEE